MEIISDKENQIKTEEKNGKKIGLKFDRKFRKKQRWYLKTLKLNMQKKILHLG